MALFAVNTDCRLNEICRLSWDWEVKISELPHFLVLIIPGAFVKNGEDRLVTCNEIALSVVKSQRGKHPTYVFTYKSKAIAWMHRSA